MTLLDFLLLLLVAGVIGTLGQLVAGYSLGGCLVSVVVGFVGAVLGSWLAGQLNLPELLTVRVGATPLPIVWSIIGSALFVFVVALLRRPRYI
ncbi:MAG TPA: GlsB/YeaQ/YmgE family stress response membrane protein [Anaerolineales bacterium]|jgi:uncharacterized membrane protein YeaQ/YmgE (transglycosylase-associated protein family)